MATEAISERFGVACHFWEAEDGTDKIQNAFVGMAHKIKMLKDCCLEYIMLTTLMIPEFINKSATDFAYCCRGEEHNLLDRFGKISLTTCKQWTLMINQWGTDTKMKNLNLLLHLVKNSCTMEHMNLIDIDFDKLVAGFQGGGVYLKMMFNFLANMDDNIVAALQWYVKDFGTQGLTKYQGESPGIAQTEMIAVCTQLDEVGQLLEDPVNDVLDGLKQC